MWTLLVLSLIFINSMRISPWIFSLVLDAFAQPIGIYKVILAKQESCSWLFPRTCTGKMRKWVIQLSSIKSLLFLFLENGWISAAGVISNNFNTLRRQITLRFVRNYWTTALNTVQWILSKYSWIWLEQHLKSNRLALPFLSNHGIPLLHPLNEILRLCISFSKRGDSFSLVTAIFFTNVACS